MDNVSINENYLSFFEDHALPKRTYLPNKKTDNEVGYCVRFYRILSLVVF